MRMIGELEDQEGAAISSWRYAAEYAMLNLR